jgi:hypothetical protein
MKNFFNSAVPYIIGIFLLFVTFQSLKLYYDETKTTTRLTDALTIANKECTYFKARNGEQAVKLQSQELTINEIRATSHSVITDLRNLYIPPRQLQSYTAASTEIAKHIETTLRDSIVMDTIKVKVIDYRDEWFTVNGRINGTLVNMDIKTIDSLSIVNYLSKRPRPWLWIFGGKRHPESVISNKNPFIKYAITKSIVVKK